MSRRRRRGRRRRVRRSRTNNFDFEYDFSIYAVDEAGETATPEVDSSDGITSYTYTDVVGDFTSYYRVDGDVFQYDPVNIVKPLTLDLTARYLTAGTSRNILGTPIATVLDGLGDPASNTIAEDTIEYTLHSPELEARGIHGLVFYLNASDIVSPEEYLSDIETIVSSLSEISDSGLVAASSDSTALTYHQADLTPKIIQAEDLVLDNYQIENYGEGQVVSLLGSEATDGVITGTITLDLDEVTDIGDISSVTIGYFDENDGEAEIAVTVIDTKGTEDTADDEIKFSDTILLDEETSDGLPTASNRREYAIANVDFNDRIVIEGTANAGEWVRIDYIGLQESGFTRTKQLTVEAEDLDLDTYRIEDYEDSEKVISLLSADGTSGTATLEVGDNDLDLDSNYDLTLGYFDENDGEAEITVKVIDTQFTEDPSDDVVKLSQTILLDEETSDGLPTEDNFREYTIENIDLEFSDRIVIEGTANAGEWVRLDYITLSPSPEVIQAEDLNLEGYQVESYEEGGLISLLGAGTDTGTATLTTEEHDFSGFYDVTIAYFDENDGIADLSLVVTDTADSSIVATHDLVFDEETSSGLPTEATRREYTIEDLLVLPEYEISIVGTRNAGEWARVDYLSFEIDTELTVSSSDF